MKRNYRVAGASVNGGGLGVFCDLSTSSLRKLLSSTMLCSALALSGLGLTPKTAVANQLNACLFSSSVLPDVTCVNDDPSGFGAETIINDFTINSGVTLDDSISTLSGNGFFFDSQAIVEFRQPSASSGVMTETDSNAIWGDSDTPSVTLLSSFENNGTIEDVVNDPDNQRTSIGVLIGENPKNAFSIFSPSKVANPVVSGDITNNGSVLSGQQGFVFRNAGGNFANGTDASIESFLSDGIVFGSVGGDFTNDGRIVSGAIAELDDPDAIDGIEIDFLTVNGGTAIRSPFLRSMETDGENVLEESIENVGGAFENTGTINGNAAVPFFVGLPTATDFETGHGVEISKIAGRDAEGTRLGFDNSGQISGDVTINVFGSTTPLYMVALADDLADSGFSNFTTLGGGNGVLLQTLAGNFVNSGRITGSLAFEEIEDDTDASVVMMNGGMSLQGPTSFVNFSGGNGVEIDLLTSDFLNSETGEIFGTGNGVHIDQLIGDFTNDGIIRGGVERFDDGGLFPINFDSLPEPILNFENNISVTSVPEQNGVYIETFADFETSETHTFTNNGTIQGKDRGVLIGEVINGSGLIERSLELNVALLTQPQGGFSSNFVNSIDAQIIGDNDGVFIAGSVTGNFQNQGTIIGGGTEPFDGLIALGDSPLFTPGGVEIAGGLAGDFTNDANALIQSNRGNGVIIDFGQVGNFVNNGTIEGKQSGVLIANPRQVMLQSNIAFGLSVMDVGNTTIEGDEIDNGNNTVEPQQTFALDGDFINGTNAQINAAEMGVVIIGAVDGDVTNLGDIDAGLDGVFVSSTTLPFTIERAVLEPPMTAFQPAITMSELASPGMSDLQVSGQAGISPLSFNVFPSSADVVAVEGNLTNGQGASIEAGGSGISVEGQVNGNISNAGNIESNIIDETDESGFSIRGPALSVTGRVTGDVTNTADGTIKANNGFGISLGGGLTGDFTNDGTIEGSIGGVRVAIDRLFFSPRLISASSEFESDGDPDRDLEFELKGNFTNNGTIRVVANENEDDESNRFVVEQDAAVAVEGTLKGNFSNGVEGEISGGQAAVGIFGIDGNFDNQGTIEGLEVGLAAFAIDGNVTNSGTIRGVRPAVLDMNEEGIEIDDGSEGVFINALTGDFTNLSGGVIEGQISGAEIGITGDFINDGSITGGLVGLFGVSTSGKLTNTGTISGGRAGVGFVTVPSSVTRDGSLVGEVENNAIVENSGTIIAQEGGIGLALFQFSEDTSPVQTFEPSIENEAGLTSEEDGVSFEPSTITLLNDTNGLISGGTAVSFEIDTIAAFSASELDRELLPLSAGEREEFGFDTGRLQTKDTFTNRGQLVGTEGTAVDFGGQDDTFILQPGSQITGTSDGGEGIDTLRVEGDVVVDSEFINFEEFIFDGGENGVSELNIDLMVDSALIESGTLRVNGTLSSDAGTVDVLTGATLGGTGSIQSDVIVEDGAFYEPGASIGTQNIVGDFIVNPGGTVEIEVTDNATDVINVEGGVVLNGGTLLITDLPEGVSATESETFVIVNNDGTDPITGPGFDNIVDDLAFLIATVEVGAGDGDNDVLLTVIPQTIDPTPIAQTPNQVQTATGIAGLSFTNEEAQPLLDAFRPLSTDNVLAGLNSLSGEIHPSTNFGLLSNGLSFAGGILNTFQNAFRSDGNGVSQFALHSSSEDVASALLLANQPTPTKNDPIEEALSSPATDQVSNNAFLNGYFEDADIEADGNGSQTDLRTFGTYGGYNHALNENLSIGFTAGYLNTDVDIDALFSSSEVDTAAFALQLGYVNKAIDASATVGYAHHSIETTRGVTVGAFNATATADYNADAVYGAMEIGYSKATKAAVLRPFIGGAFSVNVTDSFTETGAGASNLISTADTDSLGQFTLGVGASQALNFGKTVIIPKAEIAYDMLIGDVTPQSVFNFAAGGPGFAIAGAEPGRHRVRIQAGAAARITDQFSAFAEYQGVFSTNDASNSGLAGFKLKF